jgi:hypothetical protein
VIQSGGFPLPVLKATMLAMTVTVKAIDSQRWICRIHLFQFSRGSLFSPYRDFSRFRRTRSIRK